MAEQCGDVPEWAIGNGLRLNAALADRDRYRLAWLSARKRAADDFNNGVEALALKDAELAAEKAQHMSFTDELRRLRAFVADVRPIRDWSLVDATSPRCTCPHCTTR